MQDNAAFAKKFNFPYPLLCDTDRKIGLAYGACESSKDEYAKRITYVIGPDQKITHAFGKVNAAQHPEEILMML